MKKMTTARLLRSVALVLLPILLYYGFFLAFEPNNYFGLRSETRSGSAIGVLRAYEKNPATSIIIGDSRVAHISAEEAGAAAGRPFANIAYGGASLRELIDLLSWWLERYPDIDEVVFGLSFYTLNASYDTDRFANIKQSLDNPVAYLTGLSFHIDALDDFRYWLQGEALGGGQAEHRPPDSYLYIDEATGEQTPYPVDMIEYAEEKLGPVAQGWQLNEAQLQRLIALIEEQSARGVRFTIVLPPMHDSVRELVTRRYGIEEPMREAVKRLGETPAEVIDYEFTIPPAFDDTLWYDGFHLDYRRGLPVFTEMLFSRIGEKEAGYGA